MFGCVLRVPFVGWPLALVLVCFVLGAMVVGRILLVSLVRGALSGAALFGNGVLGLHHSATLLPGNRATVHRIVRRSNNIYITTVSDSSGVLLMGRFHCPCNRLLLRVPTNGHRAGSDTSPLAYKGHRLERRANTVTSACVSLNRLCPAPTCYARVVCVFTTGSLAFARRSLSGSRFLSIMGVPFRGTIRVILGGRVGSTGARATVLGLCTLGRGKLFWYKVHGSWYMVGRVLRYIRGSDWVLGDLLF